MGSCSCGDDSGIGTSSSRRGLPIWAIGDYLVAEISQVGHLGPFP
jgi:hypothetical protein